MIQIRSSFVFLMIHVQYSKGINFYWLNGWKCWTLASKNVCVDESNTSFGKWRATWNAFNSKTDKN